MATFGRKIGGYVIDVIVARDAAAVEAVYGVLDPPHERIPDGTVTNSKILANGLFEPPTTPVAPPAQPPTLSEVDALTARVDSMAGLLNKIAEKLGVETEAQ